MNKVTLIGNLTRNPESSATPAGISVCKFTLAVGRNYASASGERETDFFNIVAWRGLADSCGKYLSKGKKAAVSGRLENRSYEDKEGNKRTVTEINADDVEFLSPKEIDDADKIPDKPKKDSIGLKPVESDDLPF